MKEFVAHVCLYIGSVGATLLVIAALTLAVVWIKARYRRALGGWK